MQHTAIFVDVQNIYYTCRQAFGKQFNYRKLYQDIANSHCIEYAYAYAIARPDDQQIKFQDALRHIGFEVKLKPFIQRSDGSAKGDWDVGITVDVMRISSNMDKVILLSGDGDFSLLLDYVGHELGVKTEVYSVETLTAKALIDSANTYNPIDSHLLL